jgi:hypothetical protein
MAEGVLACIVGVRIVCMCFMRVSCITHGHNWIMVFTLLCVILEPSVKASGLGDILTQLCLACLV